MSVHSSQHQFIAVNVSSLQSMLVCWGTNIYRKLAAYIISCLLMALVKTGSHYSQIYSFWGNSAVDRTFKTQTLTLKNKVQLNPNTGLLLHIIISNYYLVLPSGEDTALRTEKMWGSIPWSNSNDLLYSLWSCRVVHAILYSSRKEMQTALHLVLGMTSGRGEIKTLCARDVCRLKIPQQVKHSVLAKFCWKCSQSIQAVFAQGSEQHQ